MLLTDKFMYPTKSFLKTSLKSRLPPSPDSNQQYIYIKIPQITPPYIRHWRDGIMFQKSRHRSIGPTCRRQGNAAGVSRITRRRLRGRWGDTRSWRLRPFRRGRGCIGPYGNYGRFFTKPAWAWRDRGVNCGVRKGGGGNEKKERTRRARVTAARA